MNIETAKLRLQEVLSGPGAKHWAFSPAVKALLAELEATHRQVGELTMWVKRLAYSLRNSRPRNKLHGAAIDYLSHKGLISVEDVLR